MSDDPTKDPVIEVPVAVVDPVQPVKPVDDYFTKEQVEKLLGDVRKQEKDKLYPQIESLKERSKAMQDELAKVRETTQAQLEAEQAKKFKEAEELEAKRREEADVRALLEEERAARVREREEQEKSLQAQLQAMRDEREAEKAILEREKRHLGLLDYRNRRLSEERENDTIDPRFYDYIHGDSEEDIENQINLAKAKTEEIAQEFARASQGRPAPKGVSPVSPITGPSDMISGGTKRYSAEDIKNMSWSEYEKVRPSLLQVAKPSDRGMFG